jgi:hypothetical protein
MLRGVGVEVVVGAASRRDVGVAVAGRRVDVGRAGAGVGVDVFVGRTVHVAVVCGPG